jgi:hypothetical protein
MSMALMVEIQRSRVQIHPKLRKDPIVGQEGGQALKASSAEGVCRRR